MGLGAPKKRAKLSHDPNNTAWSKSTTTFGHKILTSQGWKPGDYLGAKNAGHSEHYTAANASHIRAVLREDNLGLGAKIGKGNAETFGLSMFSGLLGRLNGKSDVELQKQEAARRDVELRTYQAQKYGFMNFVSGGFLIGDKIEAMMAKQEGDGQDRKNAAPIKADFTGDRERKAIEEADQPTVSGRKKKSKTRPVSTAPEFDKSAKTSTTSLERKVELDDEDSPNPDSSAREKKRREKAERKAQKAARESQRLVVEEADARAKAEKRARKEERRKRREEKRKKRAETGESSSVPPTQSATPVSDSESATDSPGTIKPMPAQPNRHAVRQRYIQQKRMASMDPQALKEIFMLQAAS